jgi:hypothetical protein
MGMFDSLHVYVKLPLTEKEQKTFSHIDWSEQVFQTKDLDCTLSTYAITKKGILSYLKVEGDWVRTMTKEEEKKAKKKNKFVWPHKFEETSRKYVKQKFNGDVSFYDGILDDKGNEWWMEFTATFINGKLQGEIKRENIRISETAKQIKKRNDDWEAMIEADKKKLHNRFRAFMNKITFNNYRSFWFNLSKVLHKLNSLIAKTELFINRTIA